MSLAVRGAPAIGIAAAYGMALAAERGEDLELAFETLAASRPTAVNLRWALEAMRDEPTRERAEAIHADEVERCRRMGANAVELFPAGARVLTHCNAGGLATGGYGSALGAIRAAAEARPRRARLGGRDATAPPGQPADRVGARAARHRAHGDRRRVLQRRSWRAATWISSSPVPIGSPRTATSRTRSARTRWPSSRRTTSCRSSSSRRPRRSTRRRRPGAEIPIEERDPAEVTSGSPLGTPRSTSRRRTLVTAIVTEHGVHRAPYARPCRRRWRPPDEPEADRRRDDASCSSGTGSTAALRRLRARSPTVAVGRGEYRRRRRRASHVDDIEHCPRRARPAGSGAGEPGLEALRPVGSARSSSPVGWRRGSEAS